MPSRIIPFALFVCVCIPAHATPELYKMTDLGPGLAYGINSQRDVVGIRTDTYEAFVCPEGGARSYLGIYTLDTADINDSGRVMGYYFYESYLTRSYAWTWLTGNLLRLTDPGYSRGWELNNQNQVAGEFQPATYNHAFVWSETGGMVDLGTLGGNVSRAYGINSSGEVVGNSTIATGTSHMFRWHPDTGMVDLGAYSGIAYDINDQGQIAAYGSSPAGFGSLLYQNGSFQVLPMIEGRYFTPRRINNSGVVIGNTSNYIPVVWDAERGVRKINNVIDATTNPGIIVQYIYDINERGDMAGYGWSAAEQTHHAIILAGEDPDGVPPVIAGLTVDPATLWPPRDDMRQVNVAYTVTDDRDPAPTARIASITCSQASYVDGQDGMIVDGHQVSLRAFRDEDDRAGRIYTITVEAQDEAGNTAIAMIEVVVPHNPERPDPPDKPGQNK